MIIKCLACRQEMSLNPATFQSHDGTVKCFACGALMEVRSGRAQTGTAETIAKGGNPSERRDDWRGFHRRSQEGWGGPRKPTRR